jgi:hypothetical protein
MVPRPFSAVVALVVAALGTPCGAQAFCGFFVAGSNARLTNSASQVVLMRKGNRTVMTMSNNYQGPPDSFPVACKDPRYEQWGGPSGRGTGGTNPIAAKGVATAPRGKLVLANELRSPVPSLGIAGKPPHRRKGK